jgi:cysteine desulfuration protein SufE
MDPGKARRVPSKARRATFPRRAGTFRRHRARRVTAGNCDLRAAPARAHLSAVPLTQKLQRLVGDLAVLDDPQERLGLVVERAKTIPALPAAERTDAHRVRGCVSIVWLVSEVRDGQCVFRSDAESPVVRGLVALLCEFYSGFPPAAIAASDADPLEALGLLRNLSPTRRNGLTAVRAAIRAFARAQAT